MPDNAEKSPTIMKPFCYKSLVAAPSRAEKLRQNIHFPEQPIA